MGGHAERADVHTRTSDRACRRGRLAGRHAAARRARAHALHPPVSQTTTHRARAGDPRTAELPVYTPEVLAEAVAASVSYAGVVRHLRVRLAGGTHAHIARRIRAFGIDTSHFTGQAHNKGARRPRLAPAEVLTSRPADAKRVPGKRLRQALCALGRARCLRGLRHEPELARQGAEPRGRPHQRRLVRQPPRELAHPLSELPCHHRHILWSEQGAERQRPGAGRRATAARQPWRRAATLLSTMALHAAVAK